jgi:hypothetical protein
MELRREFKDDPLGEIVLELDASGVEHGHVAMSLVICANDADVNMCVLEIGRGVDVLNCNQLRFEMAFPSDQLPELPADQFVHACETMLHGMTDREWMTGGAAHGA